MDDNELYAFMDGALEQSAAETFADAVVRVYKVFAAVMSEEMAETMAREYWGFLLDNAQTVLEQDREDELAAELREIEEAQSED